jgi:hypothetical protein
MGIAPSIELLRAVVEVSNFKKSALIKLRQATPFASSGLNYESHIPSGNTLMRGANPASLTHSAYIVPTSVDR